MNKDIQTLIERERNEAYHKEISCLSITDEEYQGYRDGYDKGIDKGIEIALSLFKWRKVSEVLPQEYLNVLVKSNEGFQIGHYNKGRWLTNYMSADWTEIQVTEWMPIPQID